jgi:hypothetical protein
MLGRNAAPRFLVPAFAVLAPLLALGFTYVTWGLSARALGSVAGCAAALYALAALALHYGRAVGDHRRPPSRVVGRALARTHALAALLLLNVAGVLILRGDALLLALALEAAVLTFASRRLSDGLLSVCGHILFGVSALMVTERLSNALVSRSAPDLSAAADLCALALLLAATFAFPDAATRTVYRVGLHLGLLVWLWRVLGSTAGDAAVTASWGLYAAGLLVAGLVLGGGWRLLVRLGTATLFLIVGKLFLVDLASVGLGTRVLLFLGLGALFLALSYYLGAFRRTGAPARGNALDLPQDDNQSHKGRVG